MHSARGYAMISDISEFVTCDSRDGKTNWSAFAYPEARMAWFQIGYCTVLTTSIREVGQLMGFGHFNKDKTGVLGWSVHRYGTVARNDCPTGQK
jgi:hypothetical protein